MYSLSILILTIVKLNTIPIDNIKKLVLIMILFNIIAYNITKMVINAPQFDSGKPKHKIINNNIIMFKNYFCII